MLSSLTVVLASASIAAAHMEMTWPPPLRSKYNPYSNPGSIDYTMTAPLLADGSNYPCKHYQVADLGTPQGRPTASFAAGQSANLTIGGGAPHGGGSCQVSVSYDRGQSFTVVQSIEGGCPASAGTTTLDFVIPYDAPQGDALLAWTWFNNLGNREMYMNCAAVTITGAAGAAAKPKRGAHAPLSSRPKLFVANVGNGCSTVDSRDVQFPQPGPDLDVRSTQGVIPPKGAGCQSSASESGLSGNQGYVVPSAAQASKPQNSDGVFVTVPPSAAATPAPASTSQAAVVPAAKASPQAIAGEVVSPSAAASNAGSSAAAAAAVADGSSSSSSSSSTSTNGATTAGTPCSEEGQWACIHDGRSFQRCASGQWSVVQAMAPGTVCHSGTQGKFEIEAASSPSIASRAHLRKLRRRGQRTAE
ncbi:hypothetical protein HMPREF1624_08661 [Sporothrix schenckii ATCC 58251]|uniref:Lytic polysaccharide monooxygenase n=1 Tax=Sporothrix schenckii (strain ATCC 58251 / de Perez 2211183) TaxID=1391915 RepID=U7PKB0_SPOS1|nr:hypothetical protein HMPREF1624_08661 [Sporothrix schenckii ATCC 58251]